MVNTGSVGIGIVVYPGAQMAAVLGLTDLLLAAEGLARKKTGSEQPLLGVSHWEKSKPGEPPRRIFDSFPDSELLPQVIVLPPSLAEPIDRDVARSFANWLQELHLNGAMLASVCGGAFLLGETGLLDGRSATTHWAYDGLMRSRFPNALIETDRLIIDDGDIITAGGLMAWTDLGLKLVERFLGPTIMMDTARMMLIDPPGREQRFYSAFSPNLTHGDAAILKLQHWLQATGAKEVDVPVLSKMAGLEERTFLRRFRKATGLTTTAYYQRLRVAKAQEGLQFSTQPVDGIAWDVGYNDTSAFRRVFHRIVGLTPAEYRRRFRGQTRSSSSADY